MSQSGGQYSNLYNSIIREIYKRDKDGSIRDVLESISFLWYAKMRYPTINIGNAKKNERAAVKVYSSSSSSVSS